MPRMAVGAAAIAAGIAALIVAPALAHGAGGYDAKGSAWAAQNWAIQASALAPLSSVCKAAESPLGPVLIASRPIPDTPAKPGAIRRAHVSCR